MTSSQYCCSAIASIDFRWLLKKLKLKETLQYKIKDNLIQVYKKYNWFQKPWIHYRWSSRWLQSIIQSQLSVTKKLSKLFPHLHSFVQTLPQHSAAKFGTYRPAILPKLYTNKFKQRMCIPGNACFLGKHLYFWTHS